MVAHRLSSIVNTDKIFVLSGGRVAQQGTHAELEAEQGGEYRRLVALQASRPADADLIREGQFEEEEAGDEGPQAAAVQVVHPHRAAVHREAGTGGGEETS